MADTEIEWADAVWNPLRGCSPTSPGCLRCYAQKTAHRFSGKGGTYEGLTKIGNTGPVWTGEVRLVPDKLDEPLRWKKPRRIFVNSMSDLFHEDVPNEYIAAVFGVMAACPQHTFQILTKRGERLPEWFAWMQPDRPSDPQHIMHECVKRYMGYDNPRRPAVNEHRWPLPNVWLGVSVEDQKRADERIPHLLRVPAAVRFLSCEPLLEAVTLPCPCGEGSLGHGRACPWSPAMRKMFAPDGGIDWVIVGGESGAGARPMQLEWARSLREQCDAAGVAYFFKQSGSKPEIREHHGDPECNDCGPTGMRRRRTSGPAASASFRLPRPQPRKRRADAWPP